MRGLDIKSRGITYAGAMKADGKATKGESMDDRKDREGETKPKQETEKQTAPLRRVDKAYAALTDTAAKDRA